MRKVNRWGDPSSCDAHHLAGPAGRASTDVLVNGLGALRTSDGGAYGGACQPAATIWRAGEGAPMVLVNNQALVGSGALTTHPHSSGRTLRGSTDVFVGGPTITVFEQARADALAMIDAAQASLSRWNEDDKRRFEEWFGVYGEHSEEARQAMMKKLEAIRDRTETAEIVHGEGEAYAYVYPKDSSKMYMEERFFETGRAGPNRQGGVIIHEASHYEDTAGTKDHIYGRSGARETAMWNPAKAQNNADNIEYFCETSPS